MLQDIKDILLLQKREIEAKLKEKYIERKADIGKFDNNLIKVITGPRRAGKSFFAVHFLNKQGNFGKPPAPRQSRPPAPGVAAKSNFLSVEGRQ
jgi:hypothetical protein